MSVIVKCRLCIECRDFKPSRDGDMLGVCQRSGQTRDWFDIGKCIKMVERSPEEVKSLVSELVRIYSNSWNDGELNGVFSGELGEFIPISEDGFVGYHVIEEKRYSRSQSSQRPTPTQGCE